MSKKYLWATALFATAALAGTVWNAQTTGGASASLVAPAFAQDSASTDASASEPTVIDMTIGNPDAAVTVVEYASFTCIHCANFHNDSYPAFKAEFIDTDKIKFVYREVYFDRFGLWAGMLARCEGPDKYFPVAELLFNERDNWFYKTDADVAAGLRKMGKIAGMSEDAVNACLADADKAKAMVAEYQKNAQADGVNSTPTFLINGENVGNPGLKGLRELLAAELEG
jgi:protein-disulfide isomerase